MRGVDFAYLSNWPTLFDSLATCLAACGGWHLLVPSIWHDYSNKLYWGAHVAVMHILVIHLYPFVGDFSQAWFPIAMVDDQGTYIIIYIYIITYIYIYIFVYYIDGSTNGEHRKTSNNGSVNTEMRSETNWFLWHPMFEILQVSSLPMGEVHVMNTDSMATPSGSSMGGPSVVNAMVGKICSDTPWVSLSHEIGGAT